MQLSKRTNWRLYLLIRVCTRQSFQYRHSRGHSIYRGSESRPALRLGSVDQPLPIRVSRQRARKRQRKIRLKPPENHEDVALRNRNSEFSRPSSFESLPLWCGKLVMAKPDPAAQLASPKMSSRVSEANRGISRRSVNREVHSPGWSVIPTEGV